MELWRALIIVDRPAAKFESGQDCAEEFFYRVGRHLCISMMAEAQIAAEDGDPIGQRLAVKIGVVMPHLINLD